MELMHKIFLVVAGVALGILFISIPLTPFGPELAHATIPEPTSLILIGTGVVGLVGYLRKK